LDFSLNHNQNISSNITPPPNGNLSILKKSVETYKLWQEYSKHFPKISRYSLGGKIDNLIIEMLEYIFTANYTPKTEKLPIIKKSINKCDLLKFFLQVSWEVKALDNKKFSVISENINEIGKMLGGWHNKIKKETSTQNK